MSFLLTGVMFGIPLVVGGWIIWQVYSKKETVGRTEFLVVLVCLLSYNTATGIEYHLPSASVLDTYVTQLIFILTMLASVTLFVFSVRYSTGYQLSAVQQSVLGLLVGIDTIVVLTNPYHSLLWTAKDTVLRFGFSYSNPVPGPLFFVHVGLNYLFILASFVLFLRLLIERDAVFSQQGAAIATAISIPLLANISSIVLEVTALNITPVSMVATGFLLAYALYWTDFQQTVPGVRSMGLSQMMDDIENGLIITGLDLSIVEMNQAVCEIFDITHDAGTGRAVSALFEKYEWGGRNVDEISVGGSAYQVRRTDLEDNAGVSIGYIFTIADITEQKQQQEQLRVLNRVLRHNLRNELSPIVLHTSEIQNHAAELEGPASEQIIESAQFIATQTETLERIGDTAREMESTIGDVTPMYAAVGTIVERAVANVRTHYPGAEIRIERETEATVSCVEKFETGVEHILRNVFDHNPVTAVEAVVTVEEHDEYVRIQIEDDGAGISDYELNAFREKSETDLHHGSGLGLWIADWLTSASGGSLELESGDWGTRATFEIPKAT